MTTEAPDRKGQPDAAPSLYEMRVAEAHVDLSKEENRELHFTLFLLRGGLCRSLADLARHVGGERAAAGRAAELERRRLIARAGGGALSLTRFGFDVIAYTHRDETELSRAVAAEFEARADELPALDEKWRSYADLLARGETPGGEEREAWFAVAGKIVELTTPAALEAATDWCATFGEEIEGEPVLTRCSSKVHEGCESRHLSECGVCGEGGARV